MYSLPIINVSIWRDIEIGSQTINSIRNKFELLSKLVKDNVHV